MFKRFLPTETSFFDFFDRLSDIVVKSTQEFQAFVSVPFDITDPQQFKKLEHDADAVVHECVEALHKTFITPIDREEILRLISDMDDIVDGVDAAFECLVIYKVEKSTPSMVKMAGILSQAAMRVELIVKRLRQMKNLDDIRKNCHQIRLLENEGDASLRIALGELFDEERDTRLLIKLKEIYEILEDAIDSCHSVANIIEGILLEYD